MRRSRGRARKPGRSTQKRRAKAPAGINHATAPSSIAVSAPTAAPPETPSTYGSASGLRSNTCNSAPAIASEPPVANAANARGSRSSCTIVRGIASPRPASARRTVVGSSAMLPTPSASANAATATAARVAIASVVGIRVIAAGLRLLCAGPAAVGRATIIASGKWTIISFRPALRPCALASQWRLPAARDGQDIRSHR